MPATDTTVARTLHDLGLAGGAVLVVNAGMGEQQRPTQVTKGLVQRLFPGR